MRDLFPNRALVGVVHLQALPGTPFSIYRMPEIISQAVSEALVLREAGFDGIILENMHDRPYLRGGVGPEIVACMAAVCAEVCKLVTLPVGIQVLAGANQEALAVALASGADFVRVEGFVFGHLADEGMIEACAGPLLRYRRQIGAQHVKILCDIKKKHASHALTADVSLAETAKAAEFFCADGVVVTGDSTGAVTSANEVKEASGACKLPVWIGSGITPDNVHDYPDAHGFIVGSWLKQGGNWTHPVDSERCVQMVRAFKAVGQS